MKEKQLSEEAHLVVVGAGALGSGLAALFQSRGCQVLLVGRTGPVQEDRIIHARAGNDIIYRASGKNLATLSIKDSQSTIVFLTVKAYDLWPAWQNAKAYLGKENVIVSLANGYVKPTLMDIKNEVPMNSVLRWGICNIGVKPLQAHHYEAVSLQEGSICWGHVSGVSSEQSILENERALQAKVSQCCFVSDISSRIAAKWVFNTTLNTLCGVYQLSQNGLALTEHGQELKQLFSEAYACAGSLFPQVQLAKMPELWENFKGLIQATATNTNSMAADRLAGRRTESDFFAGACPNLKEGSLLKKFHQRL